MKNKLLQFITVISLIAMVFPICSCRDVNSYKTFTLTEGTVYFSLEYRTYYRIDNLNPGNDTGVVSKDLMALTLISPKLKQTNDYTRINIFVAKPDSLIPDAKAHIERAERNAATWSNYKLLDKFEVTIDGVPAYRIDYQNRNIIPAIAGVSDEPFIEVVREVYFDANGFIWMIQIKSDSSTAEADKVDFEHILQTFKILD